MADGSSHGDWEQSDDAPAQVLSLSLLAEQMQLLLLLVIQRVTVLRLEETHSHTLVDKGPDQLIQYISLLGYQGKDLISLLQSC